MEWQTLRPDDNHTVACSYVNADDFRALLPIGSREAKAEQAKHDEEAIFKTFSIGVNTNRDAWVYCFDEGATRPTKSEEVLKHTTARLTVGNEQRGRGTSTTSLSMMNQSSSGAAGLRRHLHAVSLRISKKEKSGRALSSFHKKLLILRFRHESSSRRCFPIFPTMDAEKKRIRSYLSHRDRKS